MTLPLQYRLVSSGDLTGFLSAVPCDRSFDWKLGMSDGCSGFFVLFSSKVGAHAELFLSELHVCLLPVK